MVNHLAYDNFRSPITPNASTMDGLWKLSYGCCGEFVFRQANICSGHSPQFIKKESTIFGRAHTRTRIAEFVDEHSTSELSDQYIKIMVFDEALYQDSSQKRG